MEKVTTIKLSTETKKRLDRLKEYKKETYEEVLKKILFILNTSKKNPEKAQKIFKKIDSAIKRKESFEEPEEPKEKPKTER